MMPAGPATTADASATGWLPGEALAWLCASVDAVSGAFYQVDQNYQQRHFVLRNVDPALHQRYAAHLKDADPLHPSRFARRPARVVLLDQVLPPGAWPHNAYVSEFLAPQRVGHVAELFFYDRERLVAGMSLLRGRSAPAFERRDAEFLAKIHPFLERCITGLYLPGRHMAGQGMASVCNLTPREQDTLELVHQGLANKEIARRLGVALATVKTHVLSILRKTGAPSRAALIAGQFGSGREPS